MQLYFWKSPQGNFGDDLNPWLWGRLIPELAELGDDSVVFSGIGSVIGKHLPAGRINIVLGSGAGYTRIPKRNWKIYALRGQLSAKLLDTGRSLPLGDPAVLVSCLHTVAQRSNRVVFVPHWETVQFNSWRLVCDRIGCELVDPREQPLDVVEKIASSRLVIAESLHAAIIADAYRVPWVPVVCMHFNRFKWTDWLTTLQMEYRPVFLGEPWYRVLPGYWSRHNRLTFKFLEWRFSRLSNQQVNAFSRLCEGHDARLSTDKSLRTCQESLLSAVDTFREEWS